MTTIPTAFASLPVGKATSSGKARVCIASPDITGPIKNGGIGTAYKSLAMTLVRGEHEVTILYPHGTHSEDGPISQWIDFYASHGIKFIPLFLPAHTALEGTRAMKLSYVVFEYFRTCAAIYDVIHFPEWMALGYYSILAKHQGLILPNSIIVVGLHSPHLWNMRYNHEPVMDVDILTLDFMERRCVAMADVVVSPSAYMIDWCMRQGWDFPANTYVQPYVLPETHLSPIQSRTVETKITEIVFFGRLDTRKGLLLFCEALDQSVLHTRRDITLVFLGRSVDLNGLNSAELIRRRSANWQCAVKLITDFGRDEAVNYLRQPGRLAVIASLADNSPNTVYECLSIGIAFVALRTGGIPEVIAVEDRPRVCCQPSSAALAQRLEQALDNPPAPARPALDFAANEKIWNQWHSGFAAAETSSKKTFAGVSHMATGSAGGEASDKQVGTPAIPDAQDRVSICLVQQGRNEDTWHAINCLKIQDYSPVQVVLALRRSEDNGGDKLAPEILAEVQHAGWKIIFFNPLQTASVYDLAVQAADGNCLLLTDDSVGLAPNALRLFFQAMTASGADILTCAVGISNSASRMDFNTPADGIQLFAGAPLAGLLSNVFGGPAGLVTREAFASLGGFAAPTVDLPGGQTADAWWLFYARAALSDFQLRCVPLPLIWSLREAHAGNPEENPLAYALADIYRQHVDLRLGSMPLLMQGLKHKADLALPDWQGNGPIRLGLRREILETWKDIRRKTRRVRYMLKGKAPPRN